MKSLKTEGGVIEPTLQSKVSDKASLTKDQSQFLTVALERYKGKMKKLDRKLSRQQK